MCEGVRMCGSPYLPFHLAGVSDGGKHCIQVLLYKLPLSGLPQNYTQTLVQEALGVWSMTSLKPCMVN